MVKAKATKFCPRGRGQSSRTPSLGFLPCDATQRAVSLCHRLSVHHSNSTPYCRLLCATALVYEVLYLWYWVLYLLTILKNSTSRSRSQSQGRALSRPRPRPQNFVLDVSSRSRPVLEDPIPGDNAFYYFYYHSQYYVGNPTYIAPRSLWTSGRRDVAIRGYHKKMKCIFAGL